jgi:hypothetical protein
MPYTEHQFPDVDGQQGSVFLHGFLDFLTVIADRDLNPIAFSKNDLSYLVRVTRGRVCVHEAKSVLKSTSTSSIVQTLAEAANVSHTFGPVA